jgi:hypothetical protein
MITTNDGKTIEAEHLKKQVLQDCLDSKDIADKIRGIRFSIEDVEELLSMVESAFPILSLVGLESNCSGQYDMWTACKQCGYKYKCAKLNNLKEYLTKTILLIKTMYYM